MLSLSHALGFGTLNGFVDLGFEILLDLVIRMDKVVNFIPYDIKVFHI